jgi:hypothetical protein
MLQALLNRFLDKTTYQVGVSPPSVTPVQGSWPTCTIEELEELRRLFQERQFGRLTEAIYEIQSAFERDSYQEYRLEAVFNLFASPRDDYRPLFDACREFRGIPGTPYLIIVLS